MTGVPAAGRVVVVGDVMTDIVVRPHGAPAPGSDRTAAITLRQGGGGGNVAAWLGRLGVPATLAARVGAADRDALAARFAAIGVRAVLGGDPRRPTGRVVALLDPDGERSFLTDRGANAALGRRDLPPSLLDGAAWLHVSGYALFAPGPRQAALALLGAAARRGLPVSVDAASAAPLAAVGAAAFRGWTAGIALCVANEAEAAVLADSDDPAVQRARLAEAYACAVIKRGAGGAELVRPGAPVLERAARPVAARDTTGAGDAFLAGFLAARVAGATPKQCLARAVALGTLAVRQGAPAPPAPLRRRPSRSPAAPVRRCGQHPASP
jgi:sugar/nucleoside kinase (ribokinase family)